MKFPGLTDLELNVTVDLKNFVFLLPGQQHMQHHFSFLGSNISNNITVD